MGSQINLFRKASSGRPLKIFWGSDTWAKLTRRRRGWVKNVLSRKNSPHKSAVGRGVWKTSRLRAENEECVMAEEGDREITILDMQVRMWIWDLISRAMNTLKDNDQGMVHSDLNYEKITQAVVIHLVHHWLLAQNKQVFNSFVFSRQRIWQRWNDLRKLTFQNPCYWVEQWRNLPKYYVINKEDRAS